MKVWVTVLTSAPSEPPRTGAVYFDGSSSGRRVVETVIAGNLLIEENGTRLAAWSFDSIRRVDAPPALWRFRSTEAHELARLDISDDDLAGRLSGLCDNLAADEPQKGQTGRIIVWSLAAMASIILSVLFVVPYVAEVATPLIPRSFDRFLGRVAEPQINLIFGSRICERDAGKAALEKLAAVLKRGGQADSEISIKVVQHALPNAFALPGGRVVVLSALLDKANSVDELAGVLGHELGHVHHRDQVRAMLHNGGTAFLVGLLFGDVAGGSAILVATRTLLQSSYSRDVERQADHFGLELMHRLGRPSKPLGEFLVRLTKGEGQAGGTLFDSHPVSEERLATLEREDRPASGPELLTSEEWQALKRICSKEGG